MGFVLLLLSSTEGWSADFQKGVTAYNKKDYATALREWKPLAKQGNFSAQYLLGVMYRKGQGVPQDYKTAVKWYSLAAKQGNALVCDPTFSKFNNLLVLDVVRIA